MKITIKITQYIFVFLVGVSFFANDAFAHGLKKMQQTAQEGNTSISFETYPDFPVAGRVTHLEIVLTDTETRIPVSSATAPLFILQEGGGESLVLTSVLETPGHYGVSYMFPKKGKWQGRVSFNGQPVSKEFTIEVDGLVPRGWVRLGIIFFFAFILILLARHDCKTMQ